MSLRDKFKQILKAIESGGKLDPNNPVMTSGMHKGDAAVGQYGIMPKTVDYITRAEERDTGEESPYSHLEGLSTPELRKAFKQDRHIPEALRRTPEGAEEYLTNRYADQILSKYEDPMVAQAAWNQGHNADEEKLKRLSQVNPVMKTRAEKARAAMQELGLTQVPERGPSSEKIPNILDLLKLKEEE
jgi:hypothetical protein